MPADPMEVIHSIWTGTMHACINTIKDIYKCIKVRYAALKELVCWGGGGMHGRDACMG